MKQRPIIFSGEMVRAILDGRKTQTRRVVKPQPEPLTIGTGIVEGLQMYWVEQCKTRFAEPQLAEVMADLCPYGQPGDRLWVRETWADVNTCEGPAICYRADGHAQTWHDFCVVKGKDYGAGPSMNYDKYTGDYVMWIDDLLNGEPGHGWRPSIHMPRWASRITLEITGVRVERLQDVSEADSKAEGVEPQRNYLGRCYPSSRAAPLYSEPSYRDAFALLWDSINGKKYPWESNPWVWAIEFKRGEG